MRLVTVTEMKKMEKSAESAGFSTVEMMKAAGAAIAETLNRRYRTVGRRFAIGLVGGGNNGGDTLIALTRLQQMGWSALAILAKEREPKDAVLAEFLSAGGDVTSTRALSGFKVNEEDLGIVLDGLYGTGFRPPLPDAEKKLLAKVREVLPEIKWVAVDCPSGMDCTSGTVSPGTISADLTICLEAVKQGMLNYEAFPWLGELVTADLGIADRIPAGDRSRDMLLDPELVEQFIPKRSEFSHKGSFGKALVIGGSVNYPGAPVLAGKGAYAVGTGLVQVAVPESIYPVSAAGNTELTWLILEDAGGVISEIATNTAQNGLSKVDALIVGPGMGREDTTGRFLQDFLLGGKKTVKASAGFVGVGRVAARKVENKGLLPMVIDADALFLLSKEKEWFNQLPENCVLTPHPGEMAELTGLKIEEIQKDRIEIARQYANKWNKILVLKGPLSVVAEPGGRVAIIPIATSSLAKGGTGDILAGMIGGLIAQGVKPFEAAAAGAWLHARAGLLAEWLTGAAESVRVKDILKAIPKAYQALRE